MRTIEVACFLRYCLFQATDQLLLMVGRRVAELWRLAGVGVDPKLSRWGSLYRELVDGVGAASALRPLSSRMRRAAEHGILR